MEALVAFSLDKASVITSSASVPKELIATEKSLGSDTLLFCPETLAAFERPDFLREL